MPRYVNRVPEMRKHKASGRAFVRFDGRYHYLGPWGEPETKVAYERWLADWLAKGRGASAPIAGASVKEVVAAYAVFAVDYYRDPDGRPTGEAANMRDALLPVLHLYGDEPAASIGVKRLEAVRAAMIASGLCRKVVNARVNRIRRAWRWGAAREMVPPAIVVEMGMLAPLAKNRSTARESKGVNAVAEDVVRATLPHMPPAVAAMAEIQLITGCRASEAAAMRARDVDRSVDPWEYRPARHKTEHHDDARGRVVFLGPRSQAILAPFLQDKTAGYLFDPRDSGKRSGLRKKYDRRSYAQAIYRACDRAFPHPILSRIKTSRSVKLTDEQKAELKQWRKRHRWSPLQLRHAAATRIRRSRGLEASQAVLGHAKADVTQLYADRLDDIAREIAAASG